MANLSAPLIVDAVILIVPFPGRATDVCDTMFSQFVPDTSTVISKEYHPVFGCTVTIVGVSPDSSRSGPPAHLSAAL